MKLLDLLAHELPKRGGWPDGVKGIEQNPCGCLLNCVLPRQPFLFYGEIFDLCDDWKTTVVTREQYESAIAVTQQPVWDGKGLPPVGCEFLYGTHLTKAKCLGVGYHMVFASKGDPDDEDGDYEEFMISIQDSEFHAINSPKLAEVKRQKTIEAIRRVIHEDCHREYDTFRAEKIYDMFFKP